MPQQLAGKGIQCFGLETLQPATLAKCTQPGTRAAVAEAGDQQLQRLLGSCREVLVSEGQWCSRCRQWRRFDLRHMLACGEQRRMLPAKLLQLIQWLRPAKAQDDLAALVEALVEARKCLLKGRGLQGQGIPVAGMKCAQRMALRHRLQQGELLLGLRVA